MSSSYTYSHHHHLSQQHQFNFNNKNNSETNAKNLRLLEDLLRRPENRECADCTAKGPRWASVNLGVFICIRCSGIHRSMGTHISKVRSTTLDAWTPDQLETMQRIGNEHAHLIFEAKMPANTKKPDEHDDNRVVEQWIRNKYEKRMWTDPDAFSRIMKGGKAANGHHAAPPISPTEITASGSTPRKPKSKSSSKKSATSATAASAAEANATNDTGDAHVPQRPQSTPPMLTVPRTTSTPMLMATSTSVGNLLLEFDAPLTPTTPTTPASAPAAPPSALLSSSMSPKLSSLAIPKASFQAAVAIENGNARSAPAAANYHHHHTTGSSMVLQLFDSNNNNNNNSTAAAGCGTPIANPAMAMMNGGTAYPPTTPTRAAPASPSSLSAPKNSAQMKEDILSLFQQPATPQYPTAQYSVPQYGIPHQYQAVPPYPMPQYQAPHQYQATAYPPNNGYIGWHK